jgi:hypothetical protein
MIKYRGWPPIQPLVAVQEVDDPAEVAPRLQQRERARRNSKWLQSHWPMLLPRAVGKFLVVAGEEAFIADTPKDAWAQAKATHPEDNGAFLRYVPSEKGPRIYANRGRVADRR